MTLDAAAKCRAAESKELATLRDEHVFELVDCSQWGAKTTLIQE